MAKTARVLNQSYLRTATDELTEIIIKGLQEKKGHEIVSLDLRALNGAVADQFIVCHGESSTQVDALARSVEEIVFKETGESPSYVEGKQNSHWVLIDYINVVVHIFQPEHRDYYGIERLWADANIRRHTG